MERGDGEKECEGAGDGGAMAVENAHVPAAIDSSHTDAQEPPKTEDACDVPTMVSDA